MNYEIYIEESSIVRVLCNVIDEIYFKEDYTMQSKWKGAVPEDIMMKILIYGYMNDSFSSRKIEQLCKRDILLIYGYMNDSFSSRKIEQLCKRDIHFMWLLDGFVAPDHSTISRFRQKMYMPTPKPQLHGLRTAVCRALNRTLTDVDRTLRNPV